MTAPGPLAAGAREKTRMATQTSGMGQELKAPPPECVICTQDLWKTYDMGSEQQVNALSGVDISIQKTFNRDDGIVVSSTVNRPNSAPAKVELVSP